MRAREKIPLSAFNVEFRSTFHPQSLAPVIRGGSDLSPRPPGIGISSRNRANSQLFHDRICLANARQIFDAIAQKKNTHDV